MEDKIEQLQMQQRIEKRKRRREKLGLDNEEEEVGQDSLLNMKEVL